MDRDIGRREFPIWLLGDSNPPQWQSQLRSPFDPRHPVRHNIWTSVLDVIQDTVYREARLRVETHYIYIRNAVEDPNVKPAQDDVEWSRDLENEVSELRLLLKKSSPRLLLSFGAFSFEFARRALRQQPVHHYHYWTTRRLGAEFRARAAGFDPLSVNALPLLHRSIAAGRFMQSHSHFCDDPDGNYSDLVGSSIADLLLQHRDALPVWVGLTTHARSEVREPPCPIEGVEEGPTTASRRANPAISPILQQPARHPPRHTDTTPQSRHQVGRARPP